MILYTVIPCYNEEAVLAETARRLKEKYYQLCVAGKISGESRILFVNDGSSDKTWQMIEDLHRSDAIYTGVSLSKNKGHQNALLAGLMAAVDEADAIISMDADLQDDINVIDAMIDKYMNGADIVYGIRSDRKTDSTFKRTSAQTFYKLMNTMGAETVYNHADFRLMSKRAVKALDQYKEVNLFLRGIVPMIGFKSDAVYYERAKRFAGESKYPLKKMISFALDGITSLSTKPIRMITALGVCIFLLSFVMLIYTLIRFFMGETVSGWPSLIISVWAIGGLILLSIGVVGEYIGKIYLETKSRPRYHIEHNLLHDDKDKTDSHDR